MSYNIICIHIYKTDSFNILVDFCPESGPNCLIWDPMVPYGPQILIRAQKWTPINYLGPWGAIIT